MSIDQPKNGYDPLAYWTNRTKKVLAGGQAQLEERDITYVHPGVQAFLLKHMAQQEEALGRKPDILEIGSGFGRWALALAEGYRKATGVDIVQERVDWSNTNRPGEFYCFDPSQPWPLRRKVDTIFTVTVLQHVPFAATLGILREAAKHIRPSGRILLAEWRFSNATRAELDERYAQASCESHMIPKPINEMQAVFPKDWSWSGGEGCYVVEAP